jgi:hypothetical protein
MVCVFIDYKSFITLGGILLWVCFFVCDALLFVAGLFDFEEVLLRLVL